MEGIENLWVGFAAIGVVCMLILVLGVVKVMIINSERKINRKLDELLKR